ncbi:MAG: xanthine dehydrogenase family protein molybdopterin-binding subunit [Ilumatobacteraceae bacterium]|nr:xanthine dehydrogenase family protein molybdopterin-binding subunit [Ilumatobacteraceae bacterium]
MSPGTTSGGRRHSDRAGNSGVSQEAPGGSILGTRVRRTEDPALLTGAARYVADLPLERPLHAAFVRSDIPHGILTAVHLDDAAAMPGVVAVWTAAELGLPPHQGRVTAHEHFARPPLATERVRFVGEPIAVVFAETGRAAADAAEAVWADIDLLPALIDPEEAIAADAPALFPEHGSNEVRNIVDPVRLDPSIGADHVVRGRYVNQRIAVASMEPDACAAAPADDGRLTVWASTQGAQLLRTQLAAALGISPDELHLITPHVGGGFGGKIGVHSEYVVVAAAARRLGRAVRWIPTRRDDMVAMFHARAQVQYVELGCRSDGTFTGLRVRLVGDAGAYPGMGAALPVNTRKMAHGNYELPGIQFDVVTAATNTTPIGAYRGAGRPEATALIERAVDQAALELGIDPIELRERTLLTDDVFPFTTLTGVRYDSGRYRHALRTAAELVDYDDLRAEQAARRERNEPVQLGIGVAAYVEITAAGAPNEYAAVEVHADGSATVFAGTSAHGQGHQTAYAMIVSAATGIPVERMRLVDGDTDRVPVGSGTGGSRSLQIGGSAVHRAAEVLVDRARHLAASLLEADPGDIVVDVSEGTIGVVGVPAVSYTWAQLAEASTEPLDGDFIFEQLGATFPFGAHISVVEVDLETGRTVVLRHVAVDDCGTVLNPLLVEGQQHGGIAAAIGQALFEEIRFDDDGNPITSNFADYGLMSAAELPSFDVHSTETPTPLNPLGAKGIGEAATIGGTPAVQNAVIDAVSHLGIRHLDMPCTPERVWRAVRDARAGNPPPPWRPPPPIFDRLDAEAVAVDDVEATRGAIDAPDVETPGSTVDADADAL